MRKLVAAFGEAQKGKFCHPYHCQSLEELSTIFGNPPEESLGLHFAVQTILFDHAVIFFRVHEEGFSFEDYHHGLLYLKEHDKVSALCLPGVGDSALLEATDPICRKKHSLLIVTEKDLYDYLTHL